MCALVCDCQSQDARVHGVRGVVVICQSQDARVQKSLIKLNGFQNKPGNIAINYTVIDEHSSSHMHTDERA